MLSGASVLLAALVAIPLDLFAVRQRWLERSALSFTGAVQTVPSLALIVLMIPLLGISFEAALTALFLLTRCSRSCATRSPACAASTRTSRRRARIGLTPRQVLLRVELPLAVRTIIAGLRTAAIISIGVATLAAFIGQGGLGEPIVRGLYLDDVRLILSGALPAAVLAPHRLRARAAERARAEGPARSRGALSRGAW
ncbi:MAG: ABC transporter permease [Planctomycetota bacterium]